MGITVADGMVKQNGIMLQRGGGGGGGGMSGSGRKCVG